MAKKRKKPAKKHEELEVEFHVYPSKAYRHAEHLRHEDGAVHSHDPYYENHKKNYEV